MAVRTISELKALFETGDTLLESSFTDLIDTLFNQQSEGLQVESIAAADIAAVVTKSGTTPVLSKVTTGQYRIDLSSGATIANLTLTGGTGNVDGSNDFTLVIDDADGNLYRPSVGAVISNNITQDVTLFAPTFTVSAVGQITMVVPNLNFGANGWKLVLQFAASLT